MVNPLYWVSALTYALVLGAILVHDRLVNGQPQAEERSFRKMLVAVVYFCVQDAAWGLCAGSAVNSDLALMISSTVFHASTVATMYFWLDYVLSYMGSRVRHKRVYLGIVIAIETVQAVLLIINFFTPTIFYVGASGEYCTAFLRPLAFFNQYIVYLLACVLAAVFGLRARSEDRPRFLAVFVFSLVPTLSGFAQFLFPDGPFYSLGYFLSCVIIHLFIVQRDREQLKTLQIERQKLENERRVAEQIAIAKTDALTGLRNRKAYEDDVISSQGVPMSRDFVYLSADVTGLKTINDRLGHAAGDELLCGAAQCLSQCLGAYGTVYRMGGDEFAAMLFANPETLAFIRKDLDSTILSWRSDTIKELNVSCGFVSGRDHPGCTVAELAKLADDEMYREKAAFYANKGVDRRGQQSAYARLCATYTKILRVDLTNDSHKSMLMDPDEGKPELGYSVKISKWLHDFGTCGLVHPDDMEEYLAATDIDHVRAYFAEGNHHLTIFYRRRYSDVYRLAMMEMLPAEDYTHDHQSIYLYVKDIDR